MWRLEAAPLRLRPLLAVVGLIACGSDAPVEMEERREDLAPPSIAALTLTPSDRVQYGEEVSVGYEIADDVGLAWSVVSWEGAIGGRDSVSHQGVQRASRTVTIRSPRQPRPDSVFAITLSVGDAVGHVISATPPPLILADDFGPTLNAKLLRPEGFGGSTLLGVPGDTIGISIRVEDNAGLAWVGYGLERGGVRDSIAISGYADTLAFVPEITADWVGGWALTAFAWDVTGNLAEQSLLYIRVIDAVRRPLRRLTYDLLIRDAAFDSRRNALYLSLADENRIGVVPLNTFQFEEFIPTPSRPFGIDLTPGGDSLIVALNQSTYLGVVDLTRSPRQLDTLRLDLPSDTVPRWPDAVRIGATGKALVTLSFSGSGLDGRVLEYDLVNRTQRIRSDAGRDGSVGPYAVLATSADRSRLLLLDTEAGAFPIAQWYDAATDQFSTPQTIDSPVSFPPISVDESGPRALVGGTLYDEVLRPLITYSPADYNIYAPTVIAPDASVGFFSSSWGYLHVRLLDGAVQERVLLPDGQNRFLVLPGIAGLVVLGTGSIMLVDLTNPASTGFPNRPVGPRR